MTLKKVKNLFRIVIDPSPGRNQPMYRTFCFVEVGRFLSLSIRATHSYLGYELNGFSFQNI